MTHLLLALAMTLSSREVRPPARWLPPPKPVMTLTEVIVRGQRFRHDRGSDCCGCAVVTMMWDEGAYGIGGTYRGTELMSWIGGK